MSDRLELAWTAAERFARGQAVRDVQPYGAGNVNDTYLVSLGPWSPQSRFILQRLNPQVFAAPALIMENLQVLGEHVAQRLPQVLLSVGRRWEVPQVICTQQGEHHWLDAEGSCWRALSFIEGAKTLDTIEDTQQAQEVGWALGMFHFLVSDLAPERLADTLPGFHVTPEYLGHYDAIAAGRPVAASPETAYAMDFIEARRDWAPVLEQARMDGLLVVRPIHGDPKVNNVLLDIDTGQAVGLIDLDTVKPGLIHYDLGDCLRSGCNPLGEETTALAEVRFEAASCRAILTGYLSQAREFFTSGDFDFLYDGIRLIAFELGLRFFTDYLAGNVYFKARHPRHNLDRALVQFKLTERIEAQEASLRGLIRELR